MSAYGRKLAFFSLNFAQIERSPLMKADIRHFGRVLLHSNEFRAAAWPLEPTIRVKSPTRSASDPKQTFVLFL